MFTILPLVVCLVGFFFLLLPFFLLRDCMQTSILFAVMEAFEVVLSEGEAFGRHGATRHAITEVHPQVEATALGAMDAPTRSHGLLCSLLLLCSANTNWVCTLGPLSLLSETHLNLTLTTV